MKLLKKVLICAAFLCGAALFAEGASAETAVSSPATVTVNGWETDFCAYNLYNSNYFMLRDVAAALSGTDKQFNVGWKNNAVSLTRDAEYEVIGTEFAQSGSAQEDALFSVPSVTLDGEEITLIGYNINGSNYFKIRDIARLFDFSVGYSDGHILIDTSKPYAPEEPYGTGLISMAHEADFPLFINEMPIVSYVSPVDTAYNAEQLERINDNPRLNGVYVSAKGLANYGFDAQIYEDAVWFTRNRDKKFGMLDGEIINSAPTGVSEVYSSDMKVYLDGAQTRNVLINGEPYISAAELLGYGDIDGMGIDSFALSDKVKSLINIDFMKHDFQNEINNIEMKSLDRDEIYNFLEGETSVFDNYLFQYGGGFLNYDVQHSTDTNEINEKYIGNGGIETSRDGDGIYTVYYGGKLPYYDLYMGTFETGKLIDGIYLTPTRPISFGGRVQDGYRTEGGLINGYKRECVLPYDVSDNLRFGYRAVREGTIANGEYCGYYREYDDSGRLIFEGDYADFEKGNK